MANLQLVMPNPPKELQSKDTCGSGDMVSVGLIDWLLTHYKVLASLSGETLLTALLLASALPERIVPMQVREASSRNTVRITCAAY